MGNKFKINSNDEMCFLGASCVSESWGWTWTVSKAFDFANKNFCEYLLQIYLSLFEREFF